MPPPSRAPASPGARRVAGRRSVAAHRITARGKDAERASLADEVQVQVACNDQEVAVLSASPHTPGHLAVGHLVLSGHLRRPDDLREVTVSPLSRQGPQSGRGMQPGFRVEVDARPRARPRPPRPKLPPGPRLTRTQVHALMNGLRAGGALYLAGGGVHSSALATPDGIVLLAEDVGKVNTLDRLAGQAFLRGVATPGYVLLCTGRLTGAMATKALGMGCPWLVSNSAPTTAGLDLARQAGATVAGYVRGSSFVLHAGGRRLTRG